MEIDFRDITQIVNKFHYDIYEPYTLTTLVTTEQSIAAGC
jgi:hypothetical protein